MKIGVPAGLAREFSVLLKGTWCLFPVLTFVAMWRSYRYLKQHNTTPWDGDRYAIHYRAKGSLQTTLNILGFGFLFAIYILPIIAAAAFLFYVSPPN